MDVAPGGDRLRELEEQLKKTQAELEEYRRMLHAVQEFFPVGVAIATHPDAAIRTAEPQDLAAESSPVPRPAGAGTNLFSPEWSLYHTDGKPLAPDEIPIVRATLKGEVIDNEEMLLMLPSGERILTRISAVPVRDKDGKIIAGLAGFNHVAEYQNLARQLHRSTASLRSVLNSLVDSYFVLDRDWRLIDLNHVAEEKLFGHSRESLLGKSIWDLYPQAKETGFYEPYIAALERNESVHFELPTALASKWFEVHALPSEDRITVFIHDITDRKSAEDALRRTEHRYRTLFEAMTEGFALNEIICDKDGRPYDLRFIAANSAFERHTGLKTSDIIKRTALEIFPDAEPEWFERFGKVALTGEPTHFEARFGPLKRWFSVTAFQTEPGRFGVIFTDITQRRESEEIVRRERALLDNITRSTDVLLACFDTNFNFIWVNNAYAEAGRVPLDGLIGKNHFALFPNTENETIFRQVRDTGQQVFFKDKPFEYADQPDRGVTYWDWSLTPIKNNSDQVEALVLALRETTPFKRAQEALRQSEERLRLVLANSPDVAFMQDLDLRYTWINNPAAPLTEAEVIGKTDSELLPPREAESLIALKRRVLLTGERGRAELQLSPAAADARWFEAIYEPQKDAAGTIIGLFGYARDITERKRAEEAIEWVSRFPEENPNPVLRASSGGKLLYANNASRSLIDQWHCQIGAIVPDPWRTVVIEVARSGSHQTHDIPCGGKTFSVNFAYVSGTDYVNLFGRDITERRQAEDALLEALDQVRAHARRLQELNEELQTQEEELRSANDQLLMSERALRQSEEKYRELVENANSIILRMDRDGTLTFCNEYALSFFGYSERELLGRNVRVLIPPAESLTGRNLEDMANAVLARPDDHAVNENENIRKNGDRVWISWRNRAIEDADGNIIGNLAIGQDITERKRFEDALLESEQRFRTMADGIPQMIWVHNTEGKILFVNQAYTEFFGATQDEVSAHGWQPLVHPDDAPVYVAAFMDSLRSHQPFHSQARVRRHDDEWRWIESYGQPHLSPSGEFLGIAGSSSDITERKQAEFELAERSRDLAAANADLAKFGSFLAHDLRAPLRSIRGFSLILRDDCADKLDDQGRQHIDLIIDSSQQAMDLISDLTRLVKLDTGEFYPEVLDLGQIVSDAAKLITSRPSHLDSIHLGLGCPDCRINIEPGLTARADRRLITIAMTNLLENAVKFSSKSPEPAVEFGCRDHSGERVFFLKDNGAGFDMTYADRLFQPFQRLHAQSDFPGTGIGLAIVRKIVEKHRGRIWAESTPGDGATFFFTLAP